MVLLGKRIKELRTKYGLTQTELANQVGVSTATITAYECDSRQPSYDVLIKMASVFKVTIDSLLLNRSRSVIDVSDLTPEQIVRVQGLVDYLRSSDFIEVFCTRQPVDPYDVIRFKEKHPELFECIADVVKSVTEKRSNIEDN